MNILIVEDARDQRMILATVLKKQGHTVFEAENGREALDIIGAHQDVRIVISDWMMPEMDGLELLESIRGGGARTYLYFILLTGNSDSEAVVEGMNRGADDYLVKPVNFNELFARLNAGIRIIQLEQQLEKQNRQLVEAIDTINKDLESAAKTQEQLLARPATVQGVSFDWFFRPSKILGGDTLGFQPIDDRVLGFYQLDVAGHGIPSALFSFTLSNMLSESAGDGTIVREPMNQHPWYRVRSPDQVITELNRRFQATAESMLYFTIAYGVIDSQTGEVTLSLAGHPSPLWIQNSSGNVESVEIRGVPVGMAPDVSYHSISIQLQPGDRLLLYSDGLTECENLDGEQFGEQRLRECLSDTSRLDLKSVIRRVEHSIGDWSTSDSFADDVTFLILEWKPEQTV